MNPHFFSLAGVMSLVAARLAARSAQPTSPETDPLSGWRHQQRVGTARHKKRHSGLSRRQFRRARCAGYALKRARFDC